MGGTVVTVALAGWFTSARIPPLPIGRSWAYALAGTLSATRGASFKPLANDEPCLIQSWVSLGFGPSAPSCSPNYPLIPKTTLGGDEPSRHITPRLRFSFGIGVGSIACERLSGRLIEVGLVPFGAFGMSVFGFDLVAASGPLPDASLFSHLRGLVSYLRCSVVFSSCRFTR